MKEGREIAEKWVAKQRCYKTHSMKRSYGRSFPGSTKPTNVSKLCLEVLPLSEGGEAASSALGLRLYTKPSSHFNRIRDALKSLFEEHVEQRSEIFIGLDAFLKSERHLSTVCSNHELIYDKIPIGVMAWFRVQQEGGVSHAPAEMDWTRIPNQIRDAVFPYQREGIETAIRMDGKVFFCDEMGLGKSLQSIATMAYYTTPSSKQLVVCPSYLRYNWRRELTMWTDLTEENIQLVMKTKDVLDMDRSRTVVISYDLAVRKASELSRVPWTTIVVDESHYIKSRKAKRTKTLLPILKKATHLLLLSGTPALSRPSELFPQLHALLPRVFPTFSPFAFRYCDMKRTVFGWDSSGASNLEELNVLLRNVMVRRLKKNVLSQLPSKTREELTIVLRAKELKEMAPLFEQLEALSQTLRSVTVATDEDRLKVFERQSLVSELFRKTCEAKIPAVSEYLINLLDASENQHILFAHHHRMLDALEEVCIKNGVTYIRIDGKTPQNRRQDLVDAFRGDTKHRIAILGLHACSTGLNFTPCRYMTFCETTWCPANLLQAEDRIHRIGATGESVHYTYICAKGTLDERVYSKLAKKHALMDRLIDSGQNAGGFDRSTGTAFQREEHGEDLEDDEVHEDTVVNDLTRFGIHDPKFRLRNKIGVDVGLQTFLHKWGIVLPAKAVREHLLESTHPASPFHSGHSLNQNTSKDGWVNLSEYSGSIERFLHNDVVCVTDLTLQNVLLTQALEPMNRVDVFLGIDGQIPAPQHLALFAHTTSSEVGF